MNAIPPPPDPEAELPTGPQEQPPSPELRALVRLEGKFDEVLKIANKCFEELQRVTLLEERTRKLEVRVSALEIRDTEPSAAP